MLFALTQRYRELIEGELSAEDFRSNEQEFTEYVEQAISKGGKMIANIFGTDKPYYYYALAVSAASLKLGEDATNEELELITSITPTLVNLVLGSTDDVGLNPNITYRVVLGKER